MMTRLDISNRSILLIVAAMIVLIAAYFAALPALPLALQTPGSDPLYFIGVAGGLLLLVPVAFSLAKRTATTSGSPPVWFVVHVVSSCLGLVLIAVHSAGSLQTPPALNLLVLCVVVGLGAWGRVKMSPRIALTFATKHRHFAPLPTDLRTELRGFIVRKIELLRALDPAAKEGTFSVTLAHWIRHPWRSLAYTRLVYAERHLIGTAKSVGWLQAYWRTIHIAFAYLFVAGMVIHVVLVIFFAASVANGGEITWWHIS